jgi:hypothetical protein
MGVGYMPEDRRLVPELTVEENLLVPAWATRADAVIGRRRRPSPRRLSPRNVINLMDALKRSLVADRRATQSSAPKPAGGGTEPPRGVPFFSSPGPVQRPVRNSFDHLDGAGE